MSSDEPTPLSDQDKIRLKRLAKLQSATAPPSVPSSSSSATPAPSLKPTAPVAGPSKLKPTPTPATPTAPVASTSSVQTAKAPAEFTDSFEEWQDRALSTILNVTLNVDEAERTSWSKTLLIEVLNDLKSENSSLREPLKLESDWTDRLLLARLSLSPNDVMTDDPQLITVLASLPADVTAFEYLAGCWKREKIERTKLNAKKGAKPQQMAERVAVLDHVKSLIVSYCGLVLMDSSMFPQEHIKSKPLGAVELIPLLMPSRANSDFTAKTGFQPATDFASLLSELAHRFTPSATNEDSGLQEILEPILIQLGRDLILNRVDIGGGGSGGIGWREFINALQALVENKQISSMLVECRSFNLTSAGISAPQIEIYSLLGPFLRLSVFPDAFPAIASSYFPDPTAAGRGNVESAAASLRGTLAGLQGMLFNVMNSIIRAGPKPREAVLEFFGQTAKANQKRAAIRVDPKTVSTHGFIINLHSILLALAQPFLDPQFSKIDKIDANYYKNSQRIEISEETKMSATQQESEEFYKREEPDPTPPAPNFISEVFFLCCTYLHIGLMHTIKEHKGIMDQIRHMARQLKEMEADTSYRGTADEANVLNQIERYKKKKEAWNSQLEAYQIQLFDTEYLTRTVSFANLLMAWLIRQVDPKQQHPQVRISLPLPAETPLNFRMLPEFLIEDITEFLSFTSKFAPQVLADSSHEELLSFMLVFISTPYMKNPYLKGQFVEIMYYLTRPTQRSTQGCLGDVLNFNPLALKNLMGCLIHAYVEIEITGSHTQFYDKFNTRYYITQLFKLVWHNPSHREALKRESLNLDRYVRFVNLLMNDSTYLLDDGLENLNKIADLQKQMEQTELWAMKPAAERQEQEKLLRQYENQAKSDLELGHESLRLIKLFTAETVEPFLTPEIVDRLAAMLDMNLNLLAGPTCQELKVKNPQQYSFKPKELLSDIIQIYLQLGIHAQFQAAVAKDGRSYSKALFERTVRIAQRRVIKTESELQQMMKFVDAVEEIRLAEEAEDAAGEIPDEFLDPLTYEIMRDPVILPSSKTILDRSTIKQHFLSDATDPFNRQPLKWEEIQPATELNLQIQQFLADRKAKRIPAQTSAVADESMQLDTNL